MTVAAGAAGIVVAILFGLALNRTTRHRVEDPTAGPSIADLTNHALTLAVLFLAFVLVNSSASYDRARAAAVAEADVVDHLFELGEYAPEPQRQEITGSVVCYARAVYHHEWASMDRGRSPIASVWSTRLRTMFGQVKQRDTALFEMLVHSDRDRSSARRDRITEESTTTPAPVQLLMLVTLAVSLGVLAYSIPRSGNVGQIIALAALAVLLVATLGLIQDLEHPFSGLTRVAPAAIVDAAIDDAEDYTAHYGSASLPCDATGRAR